MITLLKWFFPIKNVNSDAEASPGCAPSILFLSGPESAETKAPSIKSSRSPSPRVIGSSQKQSSYVDSYLESPRVTSAPISNHMENTDSRKSIDQGQPMIKEIVLKQSRGGSGSQSVVVVLDATRELSLSALQWALTNVVCAGDAITLLGILHQVHNPSTLPLKLAIHAGMLQLLGYKQKADVSTFNGTNRKQLDEEISRKLEIFRNASMHQEIHKVCEHNGIKLEVKIAAGPSTKTVAAKWAVELQAAWVILDRPMKKDKKYLMEHLTCNLVLMKRSGGEVIRLNQPKGGAEEFHGEDLPETPSCVVSPDVLMLMDKRSEQSPEYVSGKELPYPGCEMECSTSPTLKSTSRASSSLSIADQCAWETTTSDVDSGSEMIDLKNVPSYENMLLATSEPPSDSEPTGVTALGTSRGSIQIDDKTFKALNDLRRHPSSPREDSGRISNSASTDNGVITDQSPTLTPTKKKISGTNSATSLQGQMLNVSSADIQSGTVTDETSARTAVATTFNKEWTPKSHSNVQQIESPRMYQIVNSSSPTSNRPPSSHGRGPVSFSNTAETLIFKSHPSNVYHPRPISVLPRRNIEKQLLNDLLTMTDTFGDRPAERHMNPNSSVAESRQKTPPIEIPMLRSRSPIGGVISDEARSGTPPSISSLLLPEREIDRLNKYSMPPEEEYSHCEFDQNSSMRKQISVRRFSPGAPPLCSICNHKSPEFGRPPRKFTYAELEVATSNFSPENFLAEGGFGFVYKGVLKEGQAVAVKQHKLASSQGDMEFCSEVEVLSCAQHRNLVTLIGYCVENRRRLLVYEFVCNGSLDWHLSSRNSNVLEWQARQKIAVGAARGLRYLHEECRVGCIVHRDMRPNNILLTHDFVPMVGDFGLARWQPNGDTAVETRVIGTLGYLAPEYAETGQITEKADVYSFGVVLLELITGRKAIDVSRSRGQQCLTEWARPLLEERATHELLDPRLETSYDDYELYCMVHAASLCIRKEPSMRPKMSQVLRILEGDKDTTGGSSPPTAGVSRTSSTEAFTPTGYSSGLSRMESLDSYPVVARSTELMSYSSFSSSYKAEREPILAHSAPLLIGSRPSKGSGDEKPLTEKSSHQTGSRSSQVPNSSSKSGTSPKLSYNDML
ncbi:hypothetical protein Mapa_010814 [Marchantia paleacea]|nr:hypothetical protein Mapa_010814 [Marchantia paleacea]